MFGFGPFNGCPGVLRGVFRQRDVRTRPVVGLASMNIQGCNQTPVFDQRNNQQGLHADAGICCCMGMSPCIGCGVGDSNRAATARILKKIFAKIQGAPRHAGKACH